MRYCWNRLDEPVVHTLFLIGKLLWVIRKHKTVSATCPHIVVEKGGEKERQKECVVALTTFLLCLGKERNKALTLYCEAILHVAGYQSPLFNL